MRYPVADERLRGLERRFAEEGDLDAGRELVAHLRRTGEPVGGALLAADLRPPRSFASELPLAVYALTADDAVRWIGNTPSPAPLELPEHRTFWVRPLRSEPEHVARAAEELAAQQIPRFALSGRQALEPPLLPGTSSSCASSARGRR
ncbi:MAG: hypothetical protein R3F62_31280 [Planctomycetota bacterium]